MSNLYATFTEVNDHEGETWRFYIPVWGNYPALKVLSEQLDVNREGEPYPDDYPYRLDMKLITEEAVDDRVSMGDSGYMDDHNKLAGCLVIPDSLDFENHESVDDHLYKGGIERMVGDA